MDQPPSILKSCSNDTRYFEKKLYPYYSLVIYTKNDNMLEIAYFSAMVSWFDYNINYINISGSVFLLCNLF